ncbi:MAG: creatininase family protein [Bosea sp. (in: a-proteobacteria)]
MPARHWGDLTTRDFEGLDPEATIAVLPIAAIEQHGPHLPVSTDTEIASGMIAETFRQCPAEIDALFLPIQAIGKSNEHIRSPGTITLTAETALRAWTEIGEAVHRAGLRKLVFVNSHGGNVALMDIVCRELRVKCDMLAVSSSWSRLGVPPGMYTDKERAVGIHGGDMETSLMLHFRPELVKMANAINFEPSTVEISEAFDILRPTGMTAFAWIAQDIHRQGTAGDASIATAAKGKTTAEHQAALFIKLLHDVKTFSLDRLA